MIIQQHKITCQYSTMGIPIYTRSTNSFALMHVDSHTLLALDCRDVTTPLAVVTNETPSRRTNVAADAARATRRDGRTRLDRSADCLASPTRHHHVLSPSPQRRTALPSKRSTIEPRPLAERPTALACCEASDRTTLDSVHRGAVRPIRGERTMHPQPRQRSEGTRYATPLTGTTHSPGAGAAIISSAGPEDLDGDHQILPRHTRTRVDARSSVLHGDDARDDLAHRDE